MADKNRKEKSAAMATATNNYKFRVRKLSETQKMDIFFTEDVDFSKFTPIEKKSLASGMEEDEEKEEHLKDALEAQKAQNSGGDTTGIPTRNVKRIDDARYDSIYPNPNWQRGEDDPYIVAPDSDEESQELDYDADTDDEKWLEGKPEIDIGEFEKIMAILQDNDTEDLTSMSEPSSFGLRNFTRSIVDDVHVHWLHKRVNKEFKFMTRKEYENLPVGNAFKIFHPCLKMKKGGGTRSSLPAAMASSSVEGVLPGRRATRESLPIASTSRLRSPAPKRHKGPCPPKRRSRSATPAPLTSSSRHSSGAINRQGSATDKAPRPARGSSQTPFTSRQRSPAPQRQRGRPAQTRGRSSTPAPAISSTRNSSTSATNALSGLTANTPPRVARKSSQISSTSRLRSPAPQRSNGRPPTTRSRSLAPEPSAPSNEGVSQEQTRRVGRPPKKLTTTRDDSSDSQVSSSQNNAPGVRRSQRVSAYRSSCSENPEETDSRSFGGNETTRSTRRSGRILESRHRDESAETPALSDTSLPIASNAEVPTKRKGRPPKKQALNTVDKPSDVDSDNGTGLGGQTDDSVEEDGEDMLPYDTDGYFAFNRTKGCVYRAPLAHTKYLNVKTSPKDLTEPGSTSPDLQSGGLNDNPRTWSYRIGRGGRIICERFRSAMNRNTPNRSSRVLDPAEDVYFEPASQLVKELHWDGTKADIRRRLQRIEEESRLI